MAVSVSAGVSPAVARHSALVLLSLFFVTYNTGIVYFAVRGVPSGHVVYSMAGYLAGVALSALAFDACERGALWTKARYGTLLRWALFGILLLPGVFCLVTFQTASPSGTLALNLLQPLLWGLGLPVAHRLYFKHARPGRQGLGFGTAVGAGHLCWSLLSLVAAVLAASSHTEDQTPQILRFLNLLRFFSNSALAWLAWRLVSHGPEVATSRHADDVPETSLEKDASPLAWALLPFLLCFLFNGVTNYMLYSRFPGRGVYPEYMHLGMALLFPLLGLLVVRVGSGFLLPLVRASVVILVAGSLIAFRIGSGPIGNAALFVSSAAHQVLYFAGTLVLARFAYRSRHPALMTSTIWLGAILAIPGNVLAARILPALSIPVFPAAFLLAVLCALSLSSFRRAFPLPEVPSLPDEPAEESRDVDHAAKTAAFSAAFGLSGKETETLSALARFGDTRAIASFMDISDRTVRHHLGNIMRKTGTSSRKGLELFYRSWLP